MMMEFLNCDIDEYNDDDSSPDMQEVTLSSEADFVDTWSKIRDLAEAIHRGADDTLRRGYVADAPKVDDLGHDLVRLLQKVSEGEEASKRRLPPPLIRPRRRRKKCEETTSPETKPPVIVSQKRKNAGSPDMYCHSCGTTDTVEWRRGPDGSKSLCNACGLHYAKMLKREMMIPNRQTQKSAMSLNNILAE